jgi:peptidoglycan hydrolase-like protein with peptidoglycan-binding domain
MAALMGQGDPRFAMVTSWQNALMSILGASSLPVYGADGSYGAETVEATKMYQRKLGFTGGWVDGIVGPKTYQAHRAANPHISLSFTLADVTPPGYVNKVPTTETGSAAAVIANVTPAPGQGGEYTPVNVKSASTPWTMILGGVALFMFLKKKKRK